MSGAPFEHPFHSGLFGDEEVASLFSAEAQIRAMLAVEVALADLLDLPIPPMPWHTQRDGLAEIAGWIAMLTDGLGKMAGDLILLAQSDVAEIRMAGGGHVRLGETQGSGPSSWLCRCLDRSGACRGACRSG
jgi:adenylosuccinate lyase